MKAASFHKFGPPEVLQVEKWPIPERKPGQVLVAVEATSVNPVDAKIRSGKFAPWLTKLPKIPGGDVAGTIVEADSFASKFKVGDRVYGLADTFTFLKKEGAVLLIITPTSGSYAQYIAVNEAWLTPIPDQLSSEQAGATPLVALTAFQALEPANLQPGQRVLIHAGSGGVGHVAIQLAKLKGAYVVTTCGPASIDFCKKLGADEVLDYKKERFEAVYAKQLFDVIVDSIGGQYWYRNLQVLKRTGYYAHILSGAWSPKLPWWVNAQLEGAAAMLGYAKSLVSGPRYKLVFVQPNGNQMGAIARLQEQGKLRIHVDQAFPLEQASSAHRAWETGHGPGKLVISVGDTKGGAASAS